MRASHTEPEADKQHGSTGGIRSYIEKGGRALTRDLFNLSYDVRDVGALGDEAKEACAWDAEMDATCAVYGMNAPWRGKPTRTFMHFVLSPDPGDDINLPPLSELACSWDSSTSATMRSPSSSTTKTRMAYPSSTSW